jgi:N-acetyltransferase 10
VVGDHSKDAIVHLYYIMSSMDVRQNKSVLWAYKNKLLGFTSHRKKRENKIKKEIKRGTREANSEDPFELFISLNDIRYTYYKETDKILGNTYGMVSWDPGAAGCLERTGKLTIGDSAFCKISKL